MKKYTLGIVVLLAVCISPVVVQAQTKGLTDSQIQSILSLLSSFGADQSVIHNVQVSLTGGTPIIEKKPFCHIFNKDLTVGNRGDDVVALNQALAASGIDTTSNSSDFSENNAGDVVSFQAKYGIRQTGYVGPMTRAKLNALYKCRDEQEPTPVPVPQPTEPTTPCAPCDTTCSGNSNTPVSVGCLPPSTTIYEQVSEQVKCVFNGATTEQKCWGDVPASTVNTPVERYSCAGVGTCVVTVRGQSGKPMVWGSSCGGSSSTSIDGNSEYANFSCATSSSGVTVVTPNGGENWKIGETYTIHYSLRGINVDASNPILIYLQKGYDYPNVKSGVNSSLLIGTTKDTESFSYTVPADIASWPGLGSNFSVKVCTNNCTISDTSNSLFSISKPEVPISITPTPSPAQQAELYAVGVYEATSNHQFCYTTVGQISVKVLNTGKPIILALSSYEPVNWNITLEPGANLQKVILGGYHTQSVQSVTGASSAIPTSSHSFYSKENLTQGADPGNNFFYDARNPGGKYYDWATQPSMCPESAAIPADQRVPFKTTGEYYFAYQQSGSEYQKWANKLKTLTGLDIKSFQGSYSGTSFTVPATSNI